MERTLGTEKLDFRFCGKIPRKHLYLFNEIAHKIQNPFIDIIDSISQGHKMNLDWWVSSPASRNTSLSPLFHYCSCIALLQELILKKEPISEIVVDSKAFKKIIESYLAEKKINITLTLARLSMKQRVKEFIRPFYAIIGIPMRQLLLFFIARRALPLHGFPASEPLTLIDTFVMHGYIEKDRYYPGILEHLSEKEIERVWFVPHLYGIRPWQYWSVVKKLRCSERNFVLKEDFLKFRDYLFAWGYVFRRRAVKIAACLFQGVDISPLVQEEIKSFRTADSSYTALLNYRLFCRFKQAKVNLKLIIDWFENQIIDRGFNAGINRFFPDTNSIGYQGFIPIGFELNIYPTAVEKESKILPMEIGVIRKALHPSSKCPDIKVRMAPAFRYQPLWENRKYYPEKGIFTILIALPFDLEEAIELLKWIACCLKDEGLSNLRFRIKPHPTTSVSTIKKAFGIQMPERFEFVSGDFYECVEKSNLLVSAASSACMETLAKGIPVILFGNSFGLFHNPIPETITGDIWRLCYDQEELKSAIIFYQGYSSEKEKEYEELGRKIREEYFEPVTAEGMRNFLGLQGDE